MNLAQQEILDHYKNPRNYGIPEKAEKVQLSENISCGDKISLWVAFEKDRIQDIKFEGEGCSICIASASMLTENVKGLRIDEVQDILNPDINEFMNIELTPSRQKCALLAFDALRKSVTTYQNETS